MICNNKYINHKGICANKMIKENELGLCMRGDGFLCKEDQHKRLPQISHSSRNTFVQCRQAWYFRYLCGIRVKDHNKSMPLKYGSVWDEFVQYAAKGESFKNRFDELITGYQLTDFDIAIMVPVFRAYKDLNIKPSEGEHQKKFYHPTQHAVIHGILDVWNGDYFEEHKFSGSPNYYQVPYNMAPQLGTYFLQDENLKYCVVKVVKKPSLRLKKNESIDDFSNRIYSHILSYPSQYFIGYKINNGIAEYGFRYFRDEFQPLNDIIKDYDAVTLDILRSVEHYNNGQDGVFYQNRTNCHKFGSDNACEYLKICDTGRVDENFYNIKEDK